MEHPENSAEYAGLQVNSGVEQPSIINPYLKRNRFRRRELSVGEMVEGIVKGDVTILSQAVTLIESVNPDHQAKAQEDTKVKTEHAQSLDAFLKDLKANPNANLDELAQKYAEFKEEQHKKNLAADAKMQETAKEI